MKPISSSHNPDIAYDKEQVTVNINKTELIPTR